MKIINQLVAKTVNRLHKTIDRFVTFVEND